jgi:hypothetical protein
MPKLKNALLIPVGVLIMVLKLPSAAGNPMMPGSW